MKRIVIDTQGMMTSGSRNRGIGRYTTSFITALLPRLSQHEVILLCNTRFPEGVQDVLNQFQDTLPQSSFSFWEPPRDCAYARNSKSPSFRQAAKCIYRQKLLELNPDAVLLTSVMEGLGDDAILDIPDKRYGMKFFSILYDLIPQIHSNIYLKEPLVRDWYNEMITTLEKSDFLLSISDSARQEALDHMEISENSVINVSSAIDKNFGEISESSIDINRTLTSLGISENFLLYTGGIDPRKNVERLITAFAKLKSEINLDHQLVIVCKVDPNKLAEITKLSIDLGMSPGDIVMTQFVDDKTLKKIYSACSAFIFPSWHEGFGLPILEAMSFGKPVIASNRSSIPEIVALKEAMFDPFDIIQISQKIHDVLLDEPFRERLRQNAIDRSSEFSWEETADRAASAINRSLNDEPIAAFQSTDTQDVSELDLQKPRLALLTPVPPQRSGISDYSEGLIIPLSEHFDIDVISMGELSPTSPAQGLCKVRSVAWFEAMAGQYDKIVFQLGNSDFHSHMIPLLKAYGGVAVLHDFFMSGVLRHSDALNVTGEAFPRELLDSHGAKPAIEACNLRDIDRLIEDYACSRFVFDYADKVVVHSDYARHLAKSFYGEAISEKITVLPLPKAPRTGRDIRPTTLSRLDNTARVVTSLGAVSPKKRLADLVRAWSATTSAMDANTYLILAGGGAAPRYIAELETEIAQCPIPENIIITGWLNNEEITWLLRHTMVAVQLRGGSRGETSASVLDCMSMGIPTIVNKNGALAEVPDDVVCALEEAFELADLSVSIDELLSDTTRSASLGARAKDYVATTHAYSEYAGRLADLILSESREVKREAERMHAIRADVSGTFTRTNARAVLRSVQASFSSFLERTEVFFDVSSLSREEMDTLSEIQVANRLPQFRFFRVDGAEALQGFPELQALYRSQGGNGLDWRRGTITVTDDPDRLLQISDENFWRQLHSLMMFGSEETWASANIEDLRKRALCQGNLELTCNFSVAGCRSYLAFLLETMTSRIPLQSSVGAARTAPPVRLAN